MAQTIGRKMKLLSKKLDGVERHAGFAIRLPAQPTAL
jgi:hypothetical protein